MADVRADLHVGHRRTSGLWRCMRNDLYGRRTCDADRDPRSPLYPVRHILAYTVLAAVILAVGYRFYHYRWADLIWSPAPAFWNLLFRLARSVSGSVTEGSTAS